LDKISINLGQILIYGLLVALHNVFALLHTIEHRYANHELVQTLSYDLPYPTHKEC